MIDIVVGGSDRQRKNILNKINCWKKTEPLKKVSIKDYGKQLINWSYIRITADWTFKNTVNKIINFFDEQKICKKGGWGDIGNTGNMDIINYLQKNKKKKGRKK